MNDTREAANAAVTAKDFHNCGWQDVLAGVRREGYPTMSRAFAEAATKARVDGNERHEKVLCLIADACSPMLTPKSVNEPFKPYMVMDGKRSVIPDDFDEDDVRFFAEIAGDVDEPWLRARLADLVWLCGAPRESRFALMAVDAYRAIPLDTKAWVCGGNKCWSRAIQLTRMLGKGAGKRLQEIEAVILRIFRSTGQTDRFLGLRLADLMEENGLGGSDRVAVAEKLETLAIAFCTSNAFHEIREFSNAAAKWFRSADMGVKAAAMMAREAEAYVEEAEARLGSPDPSHMVATEFYENAVQIYRTIPRAERAHLNVDERIAELRERVRDSGEQSLGEMRAVSSPGIDISELVNRSRDMVSGKTAIDGLRAFCGLHEYVDMKAERAGAIARMRKYPLSTLFPATVMSMDGRVVAKRPGASNPGGNPSDDDLTVWTEMVRNYLLLLGVTVQGSILPALDVLWREHRLREADFVALARESPAVPAGRSRLFGKALFAGYDRDLTTALHLLVPQIEHLVRFHLKQRGATTTSLDRDGIENEIGLSKLMLLPSRKRFLARIFVLRSERYSATRSARTYGTSLLMGSLTMMAAKPFTRFTHGGSVSNSRSTHIGARRDNKRNQLRQIRADPAAETKSQRAPDDCPRRCW